MTDPMTHLHRVHMGHDMDSDLVRNTDRPVFTAEDCAAAPAWVLFALIVTVALAGAAALVWAN